MKRMFSCCAALLMFAATSASASTDEVNAVAAAKTYDPGSIDIFVDVLLLDDISGKMDGVDEDANAAVLTAVADNANHVMTARLKVANTTKSIGWFGDDTAVVSARNGKATGEKFQSRAMAGALPPDEAKAFFVDILQNHSKSKYNVWTGKTAVAIVPGYSVTLPESTTVGDSRYLLLVQASARKVPLAKSVAAGALLGVMPVSDGLASVAVIDKQSSKVIWEMQRTFRDFDQIRGLTWKMMTLAARSLPASIPDAVVSTPATGEPAADSAPAIR